MLHKRYVVRWVQGDDLYHAPTAYYSEFTYLDREDAEHFAEGLKKWTFVRRIEINEFIADFVVPAVIIPFSWLREQ